MESYKMFKTRESKQKKNNKYGEQESYKHDINPIISIITLNVNGQNTQIKRQRLVEWLKLYMFHNNPLRI